MKRRNLPLAPVLARHPNVSCEISPRALERWNPDVNAADEKAPATISILDVIGQDFWTGEGVTVKRISAALRAIGERDVEVHINSPGGDFFEGLAIYNVLREHAEKQNVTVKILGLAASAASVIAMAGDEIMIARAGFLMIHNTWVVAVGDRNELRDIADWLEPFDKTSADIYAARSGMEAKLIAKMLDKETWIGGEDAVEKGFADDLLPADQIEAKAKNQTADSAVAALRRIELALARGEQVPRSERRRLIKEITAGTPSAAAELGTPSAAEAAVDDGMSALRMGLARLKLARA